MVCDKESLERYLPLSCKFINLYTVLKKAKKREYFSSEQVLADFHLINHNLLTATGLTCTRDIMSVKKFIEKAQEEFDLTNQCPHCIYKWYFEKYWFLTPCPWGHKLVLAKVDGKYLICFILLYFLSKNLHILCLHNHFRSSILARKAVSL